MFEINIEDIMVDLEGLSIQEKAQKLENLSADLEDVREEVSYAKESLIDAYQKSVYDPLDASVSALIDQKHWEDLVTIKEYRRGDYYKYFFVNTKPTNVRIRIHWNLYQWGITIESTEFIVRDYKQFKAYANLAERLNLPHQQGQDLMLKVEENELQPTVIRIITTLCE